MMTRFKTTASDFDVTVANGTLTVKADGAEILRAPLKQ